MIRIKALSRVCLVLSLAVAYLSCSKEKETENDPEYAVLSQYLSVPRFPYNYAQPDLPEYFQSRFVTIQDNTPPDNGITDWGATLGRVLFYDTRLSLNHTVSCASCHMQQFGFTDTAQFSRGFNGGLTKRHSMSLINARYYMSGRFFSDERAATLEAQVLMPVLDSTEMGLTPDTLLSRLRGAPFYPLLFKRAFGDTSITPALAAKALAQFVRSIVSYRSKYDEGRAKAERSEDDFPNFTEEENLGKRIFFTHTRVNCSGCHHTDVMINDFPGNIGLHADNADPGVYAHTGDPADMGKFKTTSLKNAALRERYMHDGSIAGIDGVLEHYNTSIRPNPNLDEHLRDPGNGMPMKMDLSPQELSALKAFIETLTDYAIITDIKYSSPFR